MSVGFSSYEIARSGLFVSERGLFATGQNIANVTTPGYSRQQAVGAFANYQTDYTKNGIMQIGLGADIQEIRQIRHTFLDNIYRQESETLGYWETRSKTYQDVETIIGEPMGTGLQDSMNNFWDSWQELSKEPDSLTVRALVRQRGEALVQTMNHIGTQLDKLQSDLNTEMESKLKQVNGITAKVAVLNNTILQNEVTGDKANDYRDKRNYLLDQLSKLADVDINEMQDGQVDVTLGGYFLVQKSTSTDLYAAEKVKGDIFTVPKLAGTNIVVPIKGGEIKGLMESRGEVSGAIGGSENGSPNTKADVTFIVDNSNSGSFTSDQFNSIKQNILNYAADMKNKGLDFNFRLMTTNSSGTSTPVSYGKSNYDGFVNAVNGLSQAAATATTDYAAVFSGLASTSFGADYNKYAVVFTNDAATGNASSGEIKACITALDSKDIKASFVTDSGTNWNLVTDATGGTTYTGLAAATNVGINISADVNEQFSVIESSKNIVSDVRARLNALVSVLIRDVNYLHTSGKTLGTNSTNGKDFFTVINTGKPLEMGNIQLNSNLTDLENIAASADGSSGDNTIALSIANFRNELAIQDTTGILSPDDYYRAIVLTIGNGGAEAKSIAESQSTLVSSADSTRTSISGVSMDEEMSNMMKYKFAYDASSRALNAIDEMMQTIISKMGLVGR